MAKSKAGTVETAKRTKVAIIGYTDHRAKAPFHDDEWEIWGLNDLYYELPPIEPVDRWRWFQLHPWKEIAEYKKEPVNTDPVNFEGGPPHPRDPNHVQWLAHFAERMPIYLLEARDEVPEAKVYPKDEAFRYFSLDGSKPMKYFTNSISYMIALAIMEGFTEIGVWGVDMMMGGGVGSEYGYQRPSCEFFLGWARGAKIIVHLPDESDLLKTAYVYGDTVGNAFRKKLVEQRRMYSQRRGEIDGQLAQLNHGKAELTGAINTLDWELQSWMPGEDGTPNASAPAPGTDKRIDPNVDG